MEQNKELYDENQDLKRMNREFEIYSSIAQTEANSQYDHQFETKSLILPYVARNNAWNFDQHDMVNWKEYEAATPEDHKDQVDIVSPHPWPMEDPDAEGEAEPEDEFRKCQAEAVAAFKVARSPDEKRTAMKAGARCLGKRCDAIAKKDLISAPDAPTKKEVLEAQKACHIGSGTTEGTEAPEKKPIQNIWSPKDIYGDDEVAANSKSTDYNKVRTDPHIPIKSRNEKVVPFKAELTDNDKEDKKVFEKLERDKKDKIEDQKRLEERKKGEDAKKEKKEEKKEAKSEAKSEAKEAKSEAKGDAKAPAKEEAKAESKAPAKTEAKPETKPEAKPEAKGGIPPELDPAAASKPAALAAATVQIHSAPTTVVAPVTTAPSAPAIVASPVVTAVASAKSAAPTATAQPVAANAKPVTAATVKPAS